MHKVIPKVMILWISHYGCFLHTLKDSSIHTSTPRLMSIGMFENN
jgi:hypothetical protein